MYALLVVLIVVLILWFAMKPGWAPTPPDTSQWSDKASQVTKQATTRVTEFSKQAITKTGEVSKQAAAKAGEVSKQVTTQATQVSKQATQVSKQATAQAGQMYQGLRGQFKLRSDSGNLSKQFKQWVAESALSKRDELYATMPASADGFAIWLNGAEDKELELFTRRVAQFCASLNFDLAWLTDPEVGREPALKKVVEDAVLLYSLAAWRSSNVQQEVQSFLAYRVWLANPNRHKAYGQRLHQVLIQRGLVTVPPDLYLVPEQERLEQAANAIQKAADEHPAAFNAALRQVTGVGERAPTAPAPVPAPPAEIPAQTEAAAPTTHTRRKAAAAGVA
jgi:primosomal protein N'